MIMAHLHVRAGEQSSYANLGDLTPEIRSALAALADLDTRYAADQARVEHLTGPAAWKARLRAGIQARYLREREPLAQRLAALRA